MNKKLSASAMAFEICNKLGIKCCNGDGRCTIDGIEIGKCMEPIEYKGYKTIPKLSVLDGVFYGKITDIKDLVTWQSDTADGIMKEFRSCVDDYLDFCKEIGKEPEKPDFS